MVAKGLNAQAVKDVLTWHKRLAHASVVSMRELLGYSVEDCKSVINKCKGCPLVRHQRLYFPSSSSRSAKVFQLLHLDVWGPYNTPTFDGNKLFLTVVGDFSRVTWIFFVKIQE